MFQWAVHVGLDLTGGVTFWCIMQGCQNPEHRHGRLLSPLVTRPWLSQLVAAVIVGTVTWSLVG